MSDRLFDLPALDSDGLTRRQFLHAIGIGAAGAVGAGMLPGGVFDLPPPKRRRGTIGLEVTPIAPGTGVLVLVTLYGGNDGLNTIVPYTNGDVLRRTRAIWRSNRRRALRSTTSSASIPT